MCALYQALGVSRSASKDTIRLAYLRLAKRLHPDVNKAPGADQNFQKVREAYEVLYDENRRREYDRQLIPPSGSGTHSGDPRVNVTWMYRAGQEQAQSRGQGKPFGFTEEAAAWRARQEYEEMRRRAQQDQFYAEFNQFRYRQRILSPLV